MRVPYDAEADIALFVIDRDPADNHLMGFEIWGASHHLPQDLITALPTSTS